MPMPDSVVQFGFVIEGKGEVGALPALTRRICNELFERYAVKTTKPIRITKSKLIRAGELERAIRLAQINNEPGGPVVVVLDADEDCPAMLGPSLKSRALPYARRHGVAIVIPKFEFETWFLTAARSLGGLRGLRSGLVPPADPEAIRGAKEWLGRNMMPGRSYSPTIDQAALVAGMDLVAARSCRSFDRFCREVGRLIEAV